MPYTSYISIPSEHKAFQYLHTRRDADCRGKKESTAAVNFRSKNLE